MNILGFIGLGFLFAYLVQFFSKTPSRQLWIQLWGIKSVPKSLLKLAKIDKNGEVSFSDLSKSENEKVGKFYEKLENAASVRLTFLYNQNLIHVQSEKQNWFFAIDTDGGQKLIEETIGELDDKTSVEYVLYRRKGGWFKTPVLIAYLKIKKELGQSKKEEEIEILFEFPENLVKNSIFDRSLKRKYKIKLDENDVIADYYKNELGDDESLYCKNYKQDGKYNGFQFRVYP